MTIKDVYFLTLHEPYDESPHPVPINATIVHASTLLHPALPQPDGSMIYRCLTEFPGRTPGCIVPVSTLTFELKGGRLWHKVGDWARVSDGVVQLSRTRRCDAMRMGVPHIDRMLLALGPNADLTLHHEGGGRSWVGAYERWQILLDLAQRVHGMAGQNPLWPGENLVVPPSRPRRMPYKPLRP